jgi:hypothetical protein
VTNVARKSEEPVKHWIYRLGLFEKSILRNTFGCERQEMTGSWRQLHNEGLLGMRFFPDTCIFRITKLGTMTYAGHVPHTEKERTKCTQNFDRKTEIKRPHERLLCR